MRDHLRTLRDLELQAFFGFSRPELDLIPRCRGDSHILGPALRIAFVRVGGGPPESKRAVPAIWPRRQRQAKYS